MIFSLGEVLIDIFEREGQELLGGTSANFCATILYGVLGDGYTFSAFIASAFITALPGIIIQLVLIPWLYIFLKKAKLINN